MKLFKIIYLHLINYPIPKNLNTNFSLGFLLGVLFMFQIISGLFLVMFYTPHSDLAFKSINYIMKDVQNGWLIRYFHMNGASFIFILIYWHIGKGLFYSTYLWQSRFVWWTGYSIFLFTVATSFLGYILPWGQMSFWGVTVITQLLSITPIIGSRLVLFLWGDFQVGTITLQRIFVLHYLLPFIILGLIIIHIFTMHNVTVNSSNKWNSKYLLKEYKNINLYPYYINKDIWILTIFWSFILFILLFYPERLANPVNYIEANPSKTPKHIIPEWYFLILYSILKTIPNKVNGILIMLLVLILPLFIPIFTSYNINKSFTFFSDNSIVFLIIIFFYIDYFFNIYLYNCLLSINNFLLLSLFYWILFFIIYYYLISLYCAFSHSITSLTSLYKNQHERFHILPIYFNINKIIKNVITNKFLRNFKVLLNFYYYPKNLHICTIFYTKNTKYGLIFKYYLFIFFKHIYNKNFSIYKVNFFIFTGNFAYLIDMGYWPASSYLYQWGPYFILYFILSFDFLFESKKN